MVFKDHHLRIIDPTESVPADSADRLICSFYKTQIPNSDRKKAWIKLTSFHPQTEKEKEALKELTQNGKNYREYHQVIFDLRGNKGGNSYYGQTLLKNIYGKEYCSALFEKMSSDQYIE